MPRYVSRILSSFASLVLLLVLVFFLSRLTGDPATLFLPIDATQQMIDQFRELHGLNDPLIVQFGRYVWDVLHLDFGESLRQARPAIDVVLEAFVWTLWLALITMTLVTVAAIVIGSLAAFRPGGVFDRIVTFTSLIGASAPDFWIAIVGITVFSIGLGLLPTSGTGTRLALDPADRRAVHPPLRADPAGGARLDGAGLRLGLRQDRPRQGRLRPLDHLRPHAAQRHAAGHHRDRRPGRGLLNGAVVVETIFGFPGVGKLMIDSILTARLQRDPRRDHGHRARDLRMNLMIDIAYALLDPRIRT